MDRSTTRAPAFLLGGILILCGLGGPATAATACGDGLLEAGESCAACPADCAPASCAPGSSTQKVGIDLTTPMGSQVAAVTARVSYRGDVLRLPRDQGEAAVRKRLAPVAPPTVVSANDEGYAVRIVMVRNEGLGSGPLVEVEFDRCQHARLATAADLRCVVEGCAGSGGALPGCECTVSVR